MMRALILFISLVFSINATAQLPEADTIALDEIGELIRWGGVFTSLILIIVVYTFIKFMERVVNQISERFVQRRLLLHKIETIFQFFIYIVTAIVVVSLSLHIDDRILTMIGGTLAVAFGFGLKDLAGSLIAGLMIMVDRPFQVGDRLNFEGHYGDVVSIGLRSVRVCTLNDDIVTIPNNKFLSEITASGNFGELDMHVGINFYVAHDQDIAKARDIIAEAAASSRYIHLPKPIVVLVSQKLLQNYVAVELRLKAYVLDTRFEKLFETDINLRVIEAFRKHGIEPASVLHKTLSMNDIVSKN